MKTNPTAQLPYGGLMTFSITPEEIENAISQSDKGWLAIRKQQMEITTNPIFPRREYISLSHKLQPLRTVLLGVLKVLVR